MIRKVADDYTRFGPSRLNLPHPAEDDVSGGERLRTVESPRNTAVKKARALETDRDLREREGVYVAWGLHLAQEALRTRAAIRQVFAGPRLEETIEGRDVLRGLQGTLAPILRTTTAILDSIVKGSGDQGVLLLCDRPDHDPGGILGTPVPLILATHGVQDPGNLGSIVRSAAALGAHGLIVLPGCTDPFGSRSVRAAMGANFTLPIASTEIDRLLTLSRSAGLQLVACDPGGQRTPPEIDLRIPTVLILGSEGRGLPEDLLREVLHRVRIPMAPAVESLNVHAAAAVLLYEAARQRGFARPT